MKKKLAIILCFFMAIGSFANESVENIESKNSRQKEIQLKFGMMPFPELFLCAVAHPHPSMVFSPVVTGEYLYYLNPNNGIGCSLSIWSAISISARFSYRRIYMNKENIKLYGEFGIGAELLLFAIAYLNNGMHWFLYLVLPFIFILWIYIMLCTFLIKKRKKSLIRSIVLCSPAIQCRHMPRLCHR